MGVISLQSQYTTESDVWSFGVCLWEILQLASVRPFAEKTDEQLLYELRSLEADDEGESLWRPLEKPPLCPKEVYELMGDCWRREPSHRPTFREIHLFLQRNNLGYAPQ